MAPLFPKNTDMRKSAVYLLLLSFLVMAAVSSCGKKEKSVKQLEDEFLVQPKDSFNTTDTAEVKKLVDEFIYRLNRKDIKAAVSMLSFLDGDSIISLPKDLARRQARTLMNVQGVRYTVERLVFDQEKDNIVKVNIVLFEKKADDPRPNTTALYLKPIRRDGKWYLTTVDNMTDTNNLGGTKIQN